MSSSYLLPLDVDEACSAFTNTITDILDTFAPFKSKTVYPKQQILNAWMSSGLLNSSKTLDKLHRKRTGKLKTDTAHTKYNEFRNIYQNLKRKDKIKYYSDLFTEYSNDIRRTWATLNDVIGRKVKRVVDMTNQFPVYQTNKT